MECDTDLRSLSNELFIEISSEEMIEAYCASIYLDNILPSEEYDENKNNEYCENASEYTKELSEILTKLFSYNQSYTIVQEVYYIDRSFRDTYYNFYSSQHFDTKRYSRRISFFKGQITEKKFFENQKTDKLNDSFMGTCVLNPTINGLVGRTLINPKYILDSASIPAYMRLSEYTLHIMGHTFKVNAFPYRMQDYETIRCTEVTILNIFDYFSNSYTDYRTILPSDVHKFEDKYGYERVLPAKGITYSVLCKILKEYGFSPVLLDGSEAENNLFPGRQREMHLKRMLHYYVASGIPVALNIAYHNVSTHHSVVCIGHGEKKENAISLSDTVIRYEYRNYGHPIIDSADFYDTYMVVDDEKTVYSTICFSDYQERDFPKIKNLAVPLYKRISLDAFTAMSIVQAVINDNKIGIDSRVFNKKIIQKKEDVIVKLFMASSTSLKEFRRQTINHICAQKAYAIMLMPRFVWVCELYTKKGYEEQNAFGEIIMDATSVSSQKEYIRNLIMVNYLGTILVRFPDQRDLNFARKINCLTEDSSPIMLRSFSEINLTKIERK